MMASIPQRKFFCSSIITALTFSATLNALVSGGVRQKTTVLTHYLKLQDTLRRLRFSKRKSVNVPQTMACKRTYSEHRKSLALLRSLATLGNA